MPFVTSFIAYLMARLGQGERNSSVQFSAFFVRFSFFVGSLGSSREPSAEPPLPPIDLCGFYLSCFCPVDAGIQKRS